VVRGGGETRRKTAIAFALPFTIALMLAQPVTAATLTLEVEDRTGDVARAYDFQTYDYRTLLTDNSQIVQAGYFDMTLFWFGLKGKTYTYGMELAADLPKEGDPLPQGVDILQYTIWLDEDSWDWVSAVPSYFMVVLRYDGSSYSAALLEWPSEEVIMSLPFTIEGPRFEVRFSADSIDNTPEFWLVSGVIVYHSQYSAKMWLDAFDCDAGAPGQVITSIPWPPPES
jgi:hypothetical protein